MSNTCQNCIKYEICKEWGNVGWDEKACALYEEPKICPFERQAANIGGGECLKEKCAWWSEELKNCIVFAPILESEASLQKEINTVLYGGVVQGGED